MIQEQKGDRWGTHRVIEPAGTLPQPAWRLDNHFNTVWDNEIVVDVQILNIDAASFHQMLSTVNGDANQVGLLVQQTVAARGKQHNPITNSGGMLLGTVAHIGSAVSKNLPIKRGDRIATLTSLSLTPLAIDEVISVRVESAQLDVRGRAAIVGHAPFVKMPTDIPERVALALFDVAGAPIQIARRAHPGNSVLILGAGGKSGILCAVEARRRVGSIGRVIGIETHARSIEELRSLGVCDAILSLDATHAYTVYEQVLANNQQQEVDLAVCCVNVEAVELSTILPVREGGCAYFFSMSTSFTRAALGAEGFGKDVELVIGNGYAYKHAEYALDLIRNHAMLQELFIQRYT